MPTIGILRERITPPDPRAPLTPGQCRTIIETYENIDIHVEPSPHRCFDDKEYEAAGCKLDKKLANCDLLMGVKEVPVFDLKPDAAYMIFSHTHKGQKENRHLLRAFLENNITLYDYELMTDEKGDRLLGFGRYAGLTGAHYALLMTGKTSGKYELPTAKETKDLNTVFGLYKTINIPPVKIALTGRGLVGSGAEEVLIKAGIEKVAPEELINKSFKYPVYAQFSSEDIYEKPDGTFSREELQNHPESFQSKFPPYLEHIDTLINAMYWDPNAPRLFEIEDLQSPKRQLQNIADISCDVEGSVPITLKTSIYEPFIGYDPEKGTYIKPFEKDAVNLMAISNLPAELPEDASHSFGEKIKSIIIPELLNKESRTLKKANIVKEGELQPDFKYLEKYI